QRRVNIQAQRHECDECDSGHEAVAHEHRQFQQVDACRLRDKAERCEKRAWQCPGACAEPPCTEFVQTGHSVLLIYLTAARGCKLRCLDVRGLITAVLCFGDGLGSLGFAIRGVNSNGEARGYPASHISHLEVEYLSATATTASRRVQLYRFALRDAAVRTSCRKGILG